MTFEQTNLATQAVGAIVNRARRREGRGVRNSRPRPRARLRATLVMATLVGQVVAVPAVAATTNAAAPGPLGMSCNRLLSPDGVDYTFCTGKVPSFDGTPLDVDLSVPADLLQAHLPLVAMIGGNDNHKTTWESATARNPPSPAADGYNNVALAQRGYAVLTYSSRGAFGSCSPYDDASANPPEPPDPSVLSPTGPCRNARVAMPDRRFEVHDLKHLIGLLVDARVVDAAHVGITGFSAGGATTLLAALEGDLVTATDGATSQWRSPGGVPLDIAAAVPYAGYTDVINIMALNGRAGDGIFAPDGDRLRPAGIPGVTLDAIVPQVIATDAMMVAPANPSAGTDSFFRLAAAYMAGEPYPQNPALTNDGQDVMRWKAAFYQDDLIARSARRAHRVPLFFAYGWTDELVSPVEASSLVAKLKAADPSWPIQVALADVGHTAQNKLSDWDPIHQQIGAFLDHYLRNQPVSAAPAVSSRVTTCDTSIGATVVAPSLRDLAPDRRLLASATVQKTTWSPPAPTVKQPLTCTPVPTDPTAQGWTWPMSAPLTIMGLPQVNLVLRVTGTDADVMARLWDVDPGTSQQRLITRGGYKYSGSGGLSVASFALMGTAWRIAPGHVLQPEMAQTDTPLFAPDLLGSAVEYDGVLLSLPTRADFQ